MLHEIYYSTKQVNKAMIPTKQRCVNVKFNPIQGRIKIYANSFVPSTVELWNKLPTNLANTKDLNPIITKLFWLVWAQGGGCKQPRLITLDLEVL